ncbi:MAG: DUF427 domain-containing protein [Acidobacteriota bacterium]
MLRPSIERETPGPNQESVWDYPRPPALDLSKEHVVVRLGDVVVADTRRAFRTLETSHPPTYYLPPEDIDSSLLHPSDRSSFCEWKGSASYFHVGSGEAMLRDVAWSYPRPVKAFASLAAHVAFYPHDLDCTVDGEVVTPQQGGFYGGWITSRVVGPFKGAPGTWGW